jgi:hypothetical protein
MLRAKNAMAMKARKIQFAADTYGVAPGSVGGGCGGSPTL